MPAERTVATRELSPVRRFWREESAWFDRNRGFADSACRSSERRVLYEYLVMGIPRSARILEVGAGEGAQLRLLYQIGFRPAHMVACDINEAALSKTNCGASVCADISDLPFADRSFDLVFTSGTLIHVPPEGIQRAIAELCRVTRRYLMGYEYWEREPTEINWRGEAGLLWKDDYPHLIEREGLSLAKSVYVTHINDDGNVDCAYLAQR